MGGNGVLADDLRDLRKGRGIGSPDLRARLTPRLARLCSVEADDDLATVRSKVTVAVEQLLAGLPAEDREAVRTALALEPAAQFPTVTARRDWLAQTRPCDVRTVRRHEDRGFELAAIAAAQPGPPGAGARAEWSTRHVRATFILDGPEPALLEERTVVSLRSDLRELTASLSLPGAERPGVEAVRAEVLRGLRLVRSRRVGTEHVEFRFALPQSLDLGEEYVYEVLFRLPGYRPAPHYAVVPLRPCESADIRVRFPPGCVPEHVWRLDGVPPRVLDDTEPGPDRLRPDPVGEVHVAFRRLVQGLGYGVAWSRRPINESPEQDR